MLLLKEGSNPYAQCSQLNNGLHYAVMNQKEELVQALLWADAESGILKNDRNARNQKPEQLDNEGKFKSLFGNIFEICMNCKSVSALEKVGA